MSVLLFLLAVVVIACKLIKESAQPKYPAIKDMKSWANDKNKYGDKYADKKWLNGDYSK